MSLQPVCPDCGGRVYSDQFDEREYGYGGYTGNLVFGGIRVECVGFPSSRGVSRIEPCGWSIDYDISDLEDLALREATNG